MRPSRQFPLCILLMCLAAAGSSAQEERAFVTPPIPDVGGDAAGSALSSPAFTIRKDVGEVEVRFTATDKTGRPVHPLQATDVKVVPDGKFPAAIKSFRSQRASPIELGIVVDLSESVKPEMHVQVVAFSTEIGDLLQPGRDREFVVAFSNKTTLLQPPTSDFARVRHVLENTSGDHNLTSLFDAVVNTCGDQFGTAPPGRAEKRILLLFTDGVDNLSIHSLGDAIDAARQARVAIYAVAPRLGNPQGRHALERLTAGTGGNLTLFQASKKPDLSVASLGAMVGNEYALTFRPPDLQPGFHSLELTAPDIPALVLQSQSSYYLGSHP